jgi:hypothetical protein
MARSVTFLQLAPEFGGTKFGPFESAEIRLGSDPGSNDITLPETLGVAAQHVKLLRQQDNSFIVAPVDRAAPVFHYRAGVARPKQVTAPLAVQGGDSFSLVTAEGPRFIILVESDPRAIKAASSEADGPDWAKRMQPSAAKVGRGLMTEIKRRGFAAVLTTRLGNTGIKVWTMIRTGSIFSPMYIVTGMLMLSGWLFAGGSACTVFRLNQNKTQATRQLADCQDQLGGSRAEGGNATDEPTVPELTKRVLQDPEWSNTVLVDTDLYAAYARSLREVLAEPQRYRWVYTNKGSPYDRFSQALSSAGLPPALVRVFAFAAASPTWERSWTLVNDSEGAEVCGRGALGLTYRQAFNLGITTLQPDALVEAQVAATNDIEQLRTRLDATLSSANTTYEYRNDMIQTTGTDLQGGLACVFVDGDDDRTNLNAIAGAIKDKLGGNVTKNLPAEGGQHWVAARLVMFFAQDFKAHELERVAFSAGMSPSISMSTKDVKQERRDFAIKEAARLMARAAAIPCLARFDKEKVAIPEWFLKEPPLLGNCAILKAYVEYDRL